jgi:hypothetical protein
MLVDDTTSEGNGRPGKAVSRKATGQPSGYSDGTLEKQIRIVDLVPQRAWIHPLLFLLLSLGVSGLIGLHRWQQAQTELGLGIFDLQEAGSLAVWFNSLGLLAIAAISLIAFSLRRWRKSDYHTRYRLWLWIAVAAILSSAAVSTAWHLAAARSLAELTGWTLPGGMVLFWLLPAGLCYSLLAVRLLLEFRGCRLASAALWISFGGYCFLVASILGVELGIPESLRMTVVGGCRLAIVAILLSGLLWYTRYVLLDVQGLLPMRSSAKKRAPKRGRRSGQETEKKSRSRSGGQSQPQSTPPRGRSDLEPNTGRRAAELVSEMQLDEEDLETGNRRAKAQRKTRTRQSAETDDCDLQDTSSGGQRRKLSKAERKRLRKLKAKERRAA